MEIIIIVTKYVREGHLMRAVDLKQDPNEQWPKVYIHTLSSLNISSRVGIDLL